MTRAAWVLGGLAAGGLLLLLADWLGLVSLAAIVPDLFERLAALAVACGVLALAEVLMGRRRDALATYLKLRRAAHREAARPAHEAAALAAIDGLDAAALRLLADCLRAHSSTFLAPRGGTAVTTLIAHGLVFAHEQPPGEYDTSAWPHTVHDFAWRELTARADVLIARDTENQRREAAAERHRL